MQLYMPLNTTNDLYSLKNQTKTPSVTVQKALLCPQISCVLYFKNDLFAEMNLDDDSGVSVSCGNGKLRQWLIEQIGSRRYPGLVWENDEKTIFRIPWKHAGKQDYNREEDAALFKVRPCRSLSHTVPDNCNINLTINQDQ